MNEMLGHGQITKKEGWTVSKYYSVKKPKLPTLKIRKVK